jgi:hypothetical protein
MEVILAMKGVMHALCSAFDEEEQEYDQEQGESERFPVHKDAPDAGADAGADAVAEAEADAEADADAGVDNVAARDNGAGAGAKRPRPPEVDEDDDILLRRQPLGPTAFAPLRLPAVGTNFVVPPFFYAMHQQLEAIIAESKRVRLNGAQ